MATSSRVHRRATPPKTNPADLPTPPAAGGNGVAEAPASGPLATPPFTNREVSWLHFNERVLALALDTTMPLLERVRYLAIFSSNLDEFFMKRVGGLHRQAQANVSDLSVDGMNVQDQLEAIRRTLLPMLETHSTCWLNELQPALAAEGIRIRSYDSLDDAERNHSDQFFLRQVFPILTPLAVDPGHPFPFISNLSKSIGVILEHPSRSEPLFVRIKMPENLPRWVPLPTKLNFVPLEQVIIGNLAVLFPGMRVQEAQVFRVTRNADIELDEDDADDLLELVELELRRRRMAKPVRLELPDSMSPTMRDLIVSGTEVDPDDVYSSRGPMDMDDLFAIGNIDLPKLRFKAWVPTTPKRLRDSDVDFFAVIRSGDLLVHHPYEDFASSVERFIKTAVDDPKVLAMKMTLYRTSSDSKFVPELIRAAESGKQVAVLIELKARFDEQRNLEIAQQLEKAGVHVVYGLVGLKTHTKLAMVVRDEPDGLRVYTHIGTGNYNSKTASLYTDLGLFTCEPSISADVVDIFHYLTGRSLKNDYTKMLVAPVNMRDRFLTMIRREIDHARAGRPGLIQAKMNALQDAKIITMLYEASQAGVKVELLVRGFCCLRPQVPGLSDNIHVYSILGRFLEHSRIFYFLNDGNEEYYIGSADWMYRNLEFRVEAIAPVEDAAARQTLRSILELMLADRGHSWELTDATWNPRPVPEGTIVRDTQDVLMEQYAAKPPHLNR